MIHSNLEDARGNLFAMIDTASLALYIHLPEQHIGKSLINMKEAGSSSTFGYRNGSHELKFRTRFFHVTILIERERESLRSVSTCPT